MSALLGAFLLSAGMQEGDVASLLDRMEKARAGLRTLTARVSCLEGKDRKPVSAGLVNFRAPAEFECRLQGNREGGSAHPRDRSGTRLAFDDARAVMRSPYLSQAHFLTNCELGRPHHGAEWYRGSVAGDSPPVLFLLAQWPYRFPVVLVYDLAPKRHLSRLPQLKLGPPKEEEGRRYHVLEFRPEGDRSLRQAEAERNEDDQAMVSGEVWVDAADLRVARVRFRTLDRTRWYRFEQRDGKSGLPMLLQTGVDFDDQPRDWSMRLEFSDLRVDEELADDDITLRIPEGRIPLDLAPEPEAQYEARVAREPGDAAAWLNLGALKERRGEWGGAESAYRRVAALRPAAPEGVMALLSVLRFNDDKCAGLDVLETAIAAGLDWPLLRMEAVERLRDPEAVRSHLEALLRAIPEDVSVLREMARRAARDPAERRTLLLRAIRSDLDRGAGWDAHSIRHHDLFPTPQEREELIRLHEAAISGRPGRPWIHQGLMEMLLETGRKGQANAQALEIVALLEKGSTGLGNHYTTQIFKGFVQEQDMAAAQRLQRALSNHAHAHNRFIGLTLLGELVAIEKDLDGIVEHLDRTLRPEEEKRPHGANSRLKPFLEAVQREKKLDGLAKRLKETPAGSALGAFHTEVLSTLADLLPGADRVALLILTRERRNNQIPDRQLPFTQLQHLVREKRWAEAAAHAETLRAWPKLYEDERALLEQATAEIHEAAGAFDQAVEACDRAIVASPSRRPWVRLVRGRILLAARDAVRAAENYATALEEAAKAHETNPSWSAENMILEDLRRRLAEHRDLRDDVEAAARRSGSHLVLSVAEEAAGRSREAWEAFEQVAPERRSAALLREGVLVALAAGRIERAIELRSKLAEVAREKAKPGTWREPFDLETLNSKILAACDVQGDAAACKTFARALAAEPVNLHDLTRTIGELLLRVGEEEFIAEIDGTLAAAARTEWERFYSRQPAAWSYAELGLGARAAGIYEALLREQAWSGSYRKMGEERIRHYRETRGSTVERIVRRLETEKGWKDESLALENLFNNTKISELRRVDSAWRISSRRRDAPDLHLKLGALRADLARRIECLESLAAREGVPPEWRVRLALAYVERGQEDRAAVVWMRLIEAPVDPRTACSLLNGQLRSALDLRAAAEGLRLQAAEAWLAAARGVEDRVPAALEVAGLQKDPLRALITLAEFAVGDLPDQLGERVRQDRISIRARLPKNLLDAVRETDLPRPSPELRRLVEKLGDDDFEVRVAARAGLRRAGIAALPALVPLLDSSDADLRAHARDLLRAILGE